jgi:hypothetical protein
MALKAVTGMLGVRPRGDPAPVAVGFVNGFMSFWLLRKSPILGVGKIFVTPLAYITMGGGKLAETVAVSDATLLGIITEVMVTRRSPAPAEIIGSRIESEIMGAWAKFRR